MCICAAFLTGCVSVEQEKTVTLINPGDALPRIVIAKKPVKAAHLGALELQYHLKLITGREIPIVADDEPPSGFEIRVGESRRTLAKNKDFKFQQYLVDVNPAFIELIGYDKKDYGKFHYKTTEDGVSVRNLPSPYDAQGTLYAVYDFLENDCGVTWIDPSRYGTFARKNPCLSVRCGKIRKEPFISYRGGTFDFGHYNHLMHIRGSAGEKKWNSFAFSDLKQMRSQKDLFLLRMRTGGDYAPANHSFYWYYERFLFKNHKNFETYRPELFAKGYPGTPPQLCYSNPATVAQAVKDIRDYFDNGGYKKRYSNIGKTGFKWGENFYCLEPMDGAGFCTCGKCTAEYEPDRKQERSQHSTYWFRFVNKVAREIKKSHPDKKITTLAYASHEGLPTGIKLEDNIIVYFCFSSNRTCYSAMLEQQINRMKQWRKAYPDQPFAMWQYNCFPLETAHNGNFYCFPGFFAKEAVRQYRLFKDLNIRSGIFHCGLSGAVDNWIQLKLMMNPNYTADKLLTQYFSAYGNAGKYLREFYETVENRYCDKSLYPAGAGHQNIKIAWGILGTPEIMAKLDRLMSAAEKAAETPEEKARVQLWKLDVYDYMKEGYHSYQKRISVPAPAWSFKKIPSAGGELSKVDWSSLPVRKLPMYKRGSNEIWPLKDTSEIRGAYDEKYFYLELTEHLPPSKLVMSPKIVPFDVWELVVALQQGQPYRHYISGPDGRFIASSYGEVNWRQGVPAEESGMPAYGAKCSTDRTNKSFWTTRYAFPLATMLNKPVKEGDSFYLNLTRVVNGPLFKEKWLGIYTAVSYTTVHTIDRAAKVTLEK